MEESDPRAELLREGLQSYPDVTRALKSFEAYVGDAAKKVMMAHLEELRETTGQTDLHEPNIQVGGLDPTPSKLGVGARVWLLGNSSIHWGIKWTSPSTLAAAQSQLFVAVRVSAAHKQDRVFRALVGKVQGAEVERVPGWPYEVHVTKKVPEDLAPGSFEEALDRLVSIFLEALKNAGGMKSAIGA